MIAAILLGASGLPRTGGAEVRAEFHPSQGWQVVIATEGGRIWTPRGEHSFDDDVLNPAGDARGDGVPRVGVRPVVGLAEAVFPRATSTGFELCFARHDGSRWLPIRPVTREENASDSRPVLAYDDHGRSLLAWRRTGPLGSSLMLAGLSIDGQLWDPHAAEGWSHVPIDMISDGDDFYLAILDVEGRRILFRQVGFPFPDGGPALPFPDDSLRVAHVAARALAPPPPTAVGSNAPTTPILSDRPITLALVSFEMNRLGDLVWATWVTGDSAVEWIALRGVQVVGEGKEPFTKDKQVDSIRHHVGREVEGL